MGSNKLVNLVITVHKKNQGKCETCAYEDDVAQIVKGRLNLDDDIYNAVMQVAADETTEKTLETLGRKLQDALICREKIDPPNLSISDLYAGCIQKHLDKKIPLRITLRIEDDYAQSLPWELLHDGQRYLAPQDKVSIVRWPLQVRQMKDEKKYAEPLQVLAILCDPVADLGSANIELNQIGKILETKKVRITTLSTDADTAEEIPTINNITRMLREKNFNIIHYIGHSDFKNDIATIQLVNTEGAPFAHPDDCFARIFDDERTSELGLVVLNSCKSGFQKGFTGLARKLMEQGIPSVIGMQFNIKDKIGPTLSSEFYENLLKSDYDVERATNNTRERLFNSVTGPGRREFAAPVLYMASLTGKILNKRRSLPSWPTNEGTLQTYTPMISQFGPMPVYIDEIKSSLDYFNTLKEGIADGKVDPSFLYWTVNAVRRWKEVCEHGDYHVYDQGLSLLKQHIGDICNLLDMGYGTKDLVSLGVGTGVKDRYLLDHLLAVYKMKNINKRVFYFPVDLSVSMIREAVRTVRTLFSDYKNLGILPIAGNFLRLNALRRILDNTSDNPRIIALLGNSLGNYGEYQVLKELYDNLSDDDYLLIDVDFHGGRREDLKNFYENQKGRKFIFGPIEDCGEKIDDYTIEYDVWDGNEKGKKAISDIEGSKTVVGHLTQMGGKKLAEVGKVGDIELAKDTVRLFYSTKYDKAQFEKFIHKLGFKMYTKSIFNTADNRFSYYILYKL
jgi:CHAT domain-containing protein